MSSLNILHFTVATLMPGIATYVLSRVKSRRAWNYWTWQIVCGLVFGGIAVLGTEFGIVTDDAIMNVRDAAPISAGLFFGVPAGIIAGIIGGAERWLSAMWGRGMFTRVACSLATCAAGVYAAVLRNYVFEDKKPGRLFSCITGVVAEVLHLLLIFVTNPQNMTRAYFVVRACTFPMIIANGLAVALSAVAANMAEGKPIGAREEPPSLSKLIQERLLIVMVIGLVASTVFTMVLQDTWLFDGTLRENIVYNRKGVSDKQIMDICKTVGLSHFVKTLPQGLDTDLSENDSISAGQKQLLTIARGMVEDAPFLILDEATSNVDTRTEELVQAAMDKLMEGRTSFIIAHRLSTIRNADLILVMNEGDIIESGNHDELMKKGGFYAELYNSQFAL